MNEALSTMTRPKQIIYPIRYFNFSRGRREDAEREFEQNLTAFLGGKLNVKPIGRARAGLYLLARLAVSEKRSRVILSPYTIPDIVNMIKFAKAEPVFVDHLPNSTNIDLDRLVSLIDDSTCCVIVTHYHFNQAGMNDLREICATKGVMLVDDCALALGATDAGSKIGRTTDASVFSLSGFKTLNFFWGGAITTQSSQLARRIAVEVDQWPPLRWALYRDQLFKIMKYDLLTRSWSFSALTFPVLKRRTLRTPDKEIMPLVRMETTELDESILSRPAAAALQEWNRKFGSINPIIHHRRRNAAVYDRILQDHLVSKETPIDVRISSCLVNYPISVDPKRRTEIFKKLLAQGFDIGLSLYPNVHEMQGFDQLKGSSHNVSRLVRSVITLPTHVRISTEYAARLAEAVGSAIG